MPESGRYTSVVTPDETPCSSVPSEVYVSEEPHEIGGLRVYPLDAQRVHGKIAVEPDRLGLIGDGLDDYLDERGMETRAIPRTYSKWDEQLPDSTYGRLDTPVVEGQTGSRTGEDSAVQLCYRTEHVKAAVRVLNGGGRFSADEFDLHLSVPFAVLQRGDQAVAISPILRPLDECHEPTFHYVNGESGDEFRVSPRSVPADD